MYLCALIDYKIKLTSICFISFPFLQHIYGWSFSLCVIHNKNGSCFLFVNELILFYFLFVWKLVYMKMQETGFIYNTDSYTAVAFPVFYCDRLDLYKTTIGNTFVYIIVQPVQGWYLLFFLENSVILLRNVLKKMIHGKFFELARDEKPLLSNTGMEKLT